MLILTGPTAAGKNTVGRALALRRPRCAVVDFDLVRAMFVQPHRAPWQGDEGRAQLLLGAQHVCALATGFVATGWEVVILDVVVAETAALYRTRLAAFAPRIVQLLPAFDEIYRRFQARGPCLTDAEFREVYAQQEQFTGYDARIDNTTLLPEAVVDLLIPGLIPCPPRSAWPSPE
ncbi:MAG TPA: hypothetical protein VKY74_21735 [Chloroflexia bacterium]|nr:hypothetical protein [Chloroflexia bacterium]